MFYEINLWDRGYPNYETLENYLFVAVKLVKNSDIDKHQYSDMVLDLIEMEIFQLVMDFEKYITFWSRIEFFCTC